MVIGVSVREKPYEASMANTTARPSGVNRYFAGPWRKTTEMNTQLIASVDTNVGTAMPAAPCSVAAGSGMCSSRQQAMGVLDGDRRIVDQDADRQCQSAERHGIDGIAEEVEDDQRRQDGQRDRDHNDQCRAPGSEEQHDHQRRQAGGDGAFAQQPGDRGFDEHRLIE